MTNVNEFNDKVSSLLDFADNLKYEWEEEERDEETSAATFSFDQWIEFHQTFYLDNDHELKYIPDSKGSNSEEKITEYVTKCKPYIDGYALGPCGIFRGKLFMCRSLKCDTIENVLEQLLLRREEGKVILLYSIKFVGKRPNEVTEESECIAASGNVHKMKGYFPVTDNECFKVRFAIVPDDQL
jgi:hypothetical protein